MRVHDIPYLFFDAITPFYVINEDANKTLNPYISQINSEHYYDFNTPQGCMSMRLGTQTDAIEREHPNVQGHHRWADYLINFIKNKKILGTHSESECPPDFNGTNMVEILDKKINLSRKPQMTPKNDFNRIDSINDLTNEQKKRRLNKIFHARNRDPFIYE